MSGRKKDKNSVFARKQTIIGHRGCLQCLPAWCSSDLVHGAWWFVWASLLTTLIPIYPLISMYHRFWDKPELLPIFDSTAVYVLLIFSGLMFTVGSSALIRAVDEVALLLYSYTSCGIM